MTTSPTLYDVLVAGLPDSDRTQLEEALERAHGEQLAEAAAAEPPRVRRRRPTSRASSSPARSGD